MAVVQIFHNWHWNSSVNTVRIAGELGLKFEEVKYITDPPDAETLRAIIAKLEDPPTAPVRRDSKFKELGLGDAVSEPSARLGL